jgi:hypothetical protein
LIERNGRSQRHLSTVVRGQIGEGCKSTADVAAMSRGRGAAKPFQNGDPGIIRGALTHGGLSYHLVNWLMGGQ